MLTDKNVEELYRSKYSDAKQDEKLLQPMYYCTLQAQNSLAIPVVKAFNKWLQVPEHKMKEVEDILLILLNINKIFNNISDKEPTQDSNSNCVVIRFGISMALNSTHYASCVGMEKIRNYGKMDAILSYTDENFNLHRAQEKDVNWKNKLICPNEDEYLQMAEQSTPHFYKALNVWSAWPYLSAFLYFMRILSLRFLETGYYLRLSVGLMKLFSKNQNAPDFSKLIAALAKFFHVYDDYVNLLDLNQYFHDRAGFDDFKEGKFTFPVINAIKSKPNDTQILHLLRQRTNDDHMKQYAVKVMQNFECFEYTKKTLLNLMEEICTELKNFETNSDLTNILNTVISNLQAK